MKNKTRFLKKWPSTGHLDVHLAKSLVLDYFTFCIGRLIHSNLRLSLKWPVDW